LCTPPVALLCTKHSPKMFRLPTWRSMVNFDLIYIYIYIYICILSVSKQVRVPLFTIHGTKHRPSSLFHFLQNDGTIYGLSHQLNPLLLVKESLFTFSKKKKNGCPSLSLSTPPHYHNRLLCPNNPCINLLWR